MTARLHFPQWMGRLLILTGLVFLVYLPSIRGGFLWDDDIYVVLNYPLRYWAGLWDIWFRIRLLPQYYPLTFTSFWLDYHLWGLNPLGYHLTNLILHSLNGVLVWLLLDRLKVRGAWFVSLLFVLHPMNVESVAWITERKNVLSGFFYLSSILSYLHFKEKKAGLWPWYFVSYLFFLAALFSKTVTSVLPATILLILWWKKERALHKDLFLLTPFLATAALLGSLTLQLETRHIVSVGGHDWDFSWVDRFLIAGRALWFYLAKLAWPHPLIFIYPRWEISPAVFWQWYYPASFILLMAFLWCFRSRWRSAFTALAIFAVTLLPTLGFRNYFPMRFSFVADHFAHLASISLFALMGGYVFSVLEQHGRIRRILLTACLTVLGLLTWKRSYAYQNLEILWRDTIAKNPNSWMAHNNLGAVLTEQAKNQEAVSHFREALRLKPDLGEGYNNLGSLMMKGEKNLKKAARYYTAAVRIQPNEPTFHCNLGAVLFDLGKTREATAQYLQAMQFNPNFSGAHYNLGNVFLAEGEMKAAITEYETSLRINPDYAEAHGNLGIALSDTGKIDEAILHYQKALELNPKLANTHNNLATALIKKGRIDEATQHLNEALRLDPKNPEFQHNSLKLAFKESFSMDTDGQDDHGQAGKADSS